MWSPADTWKLEAWELEAWELEACGMEAWELEAWARLGDAGGWGREDDIY